MKEKSMLLIVFLIVIGYFIIDRFLFSNLTILNLKKFGIASLLAIGSYTILIFFFGRKNSK